MHLQEQLQEEEDMMLKWESDASERHKWLDEAINHSMLFCKPTEKSINIESLLADFEVS